MGYITTRHPKWLETVVPEEYEDEGLYKLILFFVIHSPCYNQSANSITLFDRGWKAKPWNSAKYLKDKLDYAIFKEKPAKIKPVKSREELCTKLPQMDLDDNFYLHIEEQRAAFVLSTQKGCKNKYMSLFYHIRNALAHGRLAMFPYKNNDIVFIMEDGNEIGDEENDLFEVSARIVILKSSLLNLIEILENPPFKNDFSDDILKSIEKGFQTKKKIISELEIDEYTYQKYMYILKIQGLIEYKHNKWERINR